MFPRTQAHTYTYTCTHVHMHWRALSHGTTNCITHVRRAVIVIRAGIQIRDLCSTRTDSMAFGLCRILSGRQQSQCQLKRGRSEDGIPVRFEYRLNETLVDIFGGLFATGPQLHGDGSHFTHVKSNPRSGRLNYKRGWWMINRPGRTGSGRWLFFCVAMLISLWGNKSVWMKLSEGKRGGGASN